MRAQCIRLIPDFSCHILPLPRFISTVSIWLTFVLFCLFVCLFVYEAKALGYQEQRRYVKITIKIPENHHEYLKMLSLHDQGHFTKGNPPSADHSYSEFIDFQCHKMYEAQPRKFYSLQAGAPRNFEKLILSDYLGKLLYKNAKKLTVPKKILYTGLGICAQSLSCTGSDHSSTTV